MERLYCDASFYRRIGGMAVVGPDWSAGIGGAWRQRWNIQVAFDTGWDGHAAFYASCRCASCNDAEKRALAMAFLLAYDILRSGRAEKVEILSDSLIVLNWVMNNTWVSDPILEPMRNLWEKRAVILGKVKGHTGNRGNEVADSWARKARLEHGERTGSFFVNRAHIGYPRKHY